jgi:MoaA/NifB/PqqE/SkfB family radical SAM enzyme
MKASRSLKCKIRFFHHLFGPQQLKYGVLFITHRCNMRCPYCQITQVETEELDLSRWELIVDLLSKSGVSHLNILGGEPLLRRDLVIDLTRYISSKGRGATLTTNGLLLNRSFLGQLAQAGLFMLIVSVDELERKNQGKSDFDRVATLLDFAADLGIVPVIHCVITSLNVERVPLLAEQTTQRRFFFSCSVYQSVGGVQSRHDDNLTPDLELTKQAFGQLKDIKERSGLIRTTYKYMEDYPRYAGYQRWLCDSSRTKWIAVDSDGKLMVCAEWRTNLSALETIEIPNPEWNATKAEIVEGCSGCYYECYYSEDQVFTLKGLLGELSVAKPFRDTVKRLCCANIWPLDINNINQVTYEE